MVKVHEMSTLCIRLDLVKENISGKFVKGLWCAGVADSRRLDSLKREDQPRSGVEGIQYS